MMIERTDVFPRFSLADTVAYAATLRDTFDALVGPVEASVRRGIATSEAFFIFAALGAYRPRRIVESGRARGQSTWLLARCLPETEIISVDADPDHPDASIALERLRGMPNVDCRFGDGRRLLPALTGPGDVVVIDGPKRFRAVRLAIELLRHRGPAAVFIHDCPRGSTVRRHLERHHDEAFFSDDPGFLRIACVLDRDRDPAELDAWRSPTPPARSYAGTFACLPATARRPTRADVLRARLARMGDNLGAGLRPRLVR